MVGGAAVAVALVVFPGALERREVADFSAGRLLRRKKRVVDRPLHVVAVTEVAIQLHEVVQPADHVGGRARLRAVAGAGLRIVKPLVLAGVSGDLKTTVLAGKFVLDQTGDAQQFVLRLPSVE